MCEPESHIIAMHARASIAEGVRTQISVGSAVLIQRCDRYTLGLSFPPEGSPLEVVQCYRASTKRER